MTTNLSTTKRTIILVLGVSGAGKSYACERLDRKRFHYISHDLNKKSEHVSLILNSPADKIPVYDLNLKTSTFIRRNDDKFNFVIVGVGTDFITVKQNLKNRGGKVTKGLYTRWKVMQRRFATYAIYVAYNGEDLARYLNNLLVTDE